MRQRILMTIGGLLALGLLWTPFPAGVHMSFSGPVKAERSYGILSYLRITTEYQPTRLTLGLKDLKGEIHRSPVPDLPKRIGELPRLTEETRGQTFIWQQNESEVVTIRPSAETEELNSVRLGLTIALTMVLLGGLAWIWLRRGPAIS